MNRKISRFAAVFILTVSISTVASARNCNISSDEENKLLALPYQDFDQSLQGGGWRAYGDNGCYALAAKILDRYSALHGNTLLDGQ